MKLHVACKSCKEYFNLEKKYNSLQELKEGYGDRLHLACKKCSIISEYEMTDVIAYSKINKIFARALLAFFVFFFIPSIIRTPYTWSETIIFGVLPFICLVWLLIKTNRVTRFNRENTSSISKK